MKRHALLVVLLLALSVVTNVLAWRWGTVRNMGVVGAIVEVLDGKGLIGAPASPASSPATAIADASATTAAPSNSATVAAAPRPPRAAGPHGMTWGVVDDPARRGVTTRVGCEGKAPTADRRARCDPYVGDTACTVALPLLCLEATNLRADPSQPYVRSGTDRDRLEMLHGWTGARLALTAPHVGLEMDSPAAGDRLCVASFGEGWRMAEFHDAGSGWGLRGFGPIDEKTRFWVRISDQPANCWDGRAAATAARAAASRSPSGSAAAPRP